MSDEVNLDSLVPESQARQELGNLSAMSFWRYDHYPDKAPPGWQPAIKIGPRNYRSRIMLELVKSNLAAEARQRARSQMRTPAAVSS
jgi:hypothetical protein